MYNNTCADCKFHECKSICVDKRLCNGYCRLKRAKRKCTIKICNMFILDNYFKQIF